MQESSKRTLTPEQRRLERLRQIQHRLFPGDRRLLYGDGDHLNVPIGEVIQWRQQRGRCA